MLGLGGKLEMNFFIYFDPVKLIKSGQNLSLDRTGHQGGNFSIRISI